MPHLWYISYMRFFLRLWALSFITLTQLATISQITKSKSAPEHKGVDKGLESYVNKYKDLAKKHGINFTKSVSMGFSEINAKDKGRNVVGLCTYGKEFREIDVDTKYWVKSTKETRRTLIFHEMTHCLCGRPHDYGEGKEYPNPIVEAAMKALSKYLGSMQEPFWHRQPGFYMDGCPLSVMHPIVLDDDCVDNHWDDYEDEMFNRCKPY